MERRRILRWAGISAMLVVGLGCSLIGAATPAPVMATLVPTVAPTATSVPPTATPEATLAPTATTAAVTACPPLSGVSAPQRSDVLEDDLTALLAFLNQGGDPAVFSLASQEMMQQGDLTGDGVAETVFTLIDPQSDLVVPRTVMTVYTCQAGQVSRLYRYEPGEWFSLQLIAIDDLNQDGLSDLVFSEYTCGAHTCFHTPHVWSWQGSDFVDQMGMEFSFPYPDFSVDGGQLVVASAGIGSVGAGPQRPVTTWLGWTGEVITATAVLPSPPIYRYHAFLDGEEAFAAGDFAGAETAYTSVIEDEDLVAWGAFTGEEAEREWLTALAHWRLMMLYAYQGMGSEAGAQYQFLAALDPASRGHPVVALADRFWRGYQRDGDSVAACAYSIDTAEVQPVLDFLNGFGYANPVYEQPDLCVFPDM